MTPSLFLDTAVFIAAVSRRDPHHEAAKQLVHQLQEGAWSSAHTSDYVVAEALNYARSRLRRREAERAILRLVFGAHDFPPLTPEVFRVHGGRFAKALQLYERYFDRGLSFTDATSLVLVEERRLGFLATTDRGFAGLVPVLDLRTLA